MPDERDDKRVEQNMEAFRVSTENIKISSDSVQKQYSIFVGRMTDIKQLPEAKAILDQLEDALGNFVKAIESYTCTLSAHALSFVMASESITCQLSTNDFVKHSQTNFQSFQKPYVAPTQSTIITPPGKPSRWAFRRQVRDTSESGSSQVLIIQKGLVAGHTSESIPATSLQSSVTHGVVSRAQSVADTEYSFATKTPSSISVEEIADNISPVEAVHMKSIGRWISTYLDNNSTFSQIIEAAIIDNFTATGLPRDVITYVRQRMSQVIDYDAYDELEQDASETLTWCKNFIENIY